MKILMTIALLLSAVLTAGAQGEWTVSQREADPMKNQDARKVYIYKTDGLGQVVVWDWGKAEFRLIAEKGFFHVRYSGGMRTVPVRAGIYDGNGNLEKMYDIQLVPEENTGNKWIATGDFYYFGRGDIRKVMKRMRSGKGYVRFLADLSGNQYFDIKVRPYEPK